jgi:hypothetical protein
VAPEFPQLDRKQVAVKSESLSPDQSSSALLEDYCPTGHRWIRQQLVITADVEEQALGLQPVMC